MLPAVFGPVLSEIESEVLRFRRQTKDTPAIAAAMTALRDAVNDMPEHAVSQVEGARMLGGGIPTEYAFSEVEHAVKQLGRAVLESVSIEEYQRDPDRTAKAMGQVGGKVKMLHQMLGTQ